MTTVIATRDCMVSDTLITYDPSFKGKSKIWIAKGCVWGGAGPTGVLAAFKQWTLGRGKRPEFKKPEGDEEEPSKMEILQLHPKNGIFLWINSDLPEEVDEPFYAIGTGAAYAVGAMSHGATPQEALEIAARWNTGTRLPGHIVMLPKRRGNDAKSHGE